MIRPFNPLMHLILAEELKAHPEKNAEEEGRASVLGQELLECLWIPEKKPYTFWEKVKVAFSDEVGLQQKLFDRIIAFRMQQEITPEKIRRVMFYATSALNRGTTILAAGCYLFHHYPQKFEKYATSAIDYAEDIRQTTDKNYSLPMLAVNPKTGETTPPLSEYEGKTESRLPLHSFAPIKYGRHPCLVSSAKKMETYEQMLSEPCLSNFSTNPYRFEPLKSLLSIEETKTCYPIQQHNAVVIAVNEFNKCLNREPVKICTHRGNSPAPTKQNTL